MNNAALNSAMFVLCLVCLISSTVGQYNPGSVSNEFSQPFLDQLEGSGEFDDDQLDGLRTTIPGEPGASPTSLVWCPSLQLCVRCGLSHLLLGAGD